ncbi:MAG: hypothetical protein KJS97_07575 [Alphaproteobacteria bacterium]|nr:hypothetical protein [Alphaproteobacteria bacterium]
MYRRLAAPLIVETVEVLERRIGERFPDSGLSRVAAELSEVARGASERVAALARPDWRIRAAVAVAIVAGVAGQIALLRLVHVGPSAALDAVTFAQGLESAFNLLAIIGAAVWFLLTLEERVKRARALAALHELRSLAHVVDMHQLTKDPTILLANFHRRTSASTARAMSRFELTRYLEYCSEMLALLGKLAALHAEGVRDAVVIEAVNDLETLAADLGRKIWQKITIIEQLDEAKA